MKTLNLIATSCKSVNSIGIYDYDNGCMQIFTDKICKIYSVGVSTGASDVIAPLTFSPTSEIIVIVIIIILISVLL